MQVANAALRRSWVRLIVRIGLILLLILLAAVGALALTFTSATLKTPAVVIGDLPKASPPSSMAISAVRTGTYENSAMFAYRGGGMSDTRQFAATAVLIQHPKGNLLVDAGFGNDLQKHMQLLPSIQQSPHHMETTVARALEYANMPVTTISAVIPTHAHWDHVSGTGDLPNIPLMVTAAAEKFIRSKAKGTEAINSISGLSYRRYSFDGPAYLGFPRSHDVYGDGSVVIVPAPGHTPDSVIVFANLPSGKRFAFVGDLVWQMEGLDIPAEKPWMLRWMIGEDREETNLDIGRIRAATKKFPQIKAIPAHDVGAFDGIPEFPESID